VWFGCQKLSVAQAVSGRIDPDVSKNDNIKNPRQPGIQGASQSFEYLPIAVECRDVHHT